MLFFIADTYPKYGMQNAVFVRLWGWEKRLGVGKTPYLCTVKLEVINI